MNEAMHSVVLVATALLATAAVAPCDESDPPNILFCIADDWGWPHAGVHGDPVVATPAFDRVAREGVLFEHAFVSSPSCTPSRNAILTGQYHWRLGAGANLWSWLDVEHPVYPLLLKQAGYHVGHWRQGLGPGPARAGGVRGHPSCGEACLGGAGRVPRGEALRGAILLLARRLGSAPRIRAGIGPGQRHGP